MANQTKDRREGPDPFRGKRETAIERLYRLAALACEHLPTEGINLASYQLAVCVDVATGCHNLADQMSGDLESEQAKESRTRTALSAADRKLLRQLGIKA